jgi:DNA polymerase I-like protein with 3'-5' exonuclease and polymerase domains
MTKSLPVKNSQFILKPSSSLDTWLVFDCETNGLYDEVTTIHCIVIYDLVSLQTFTYGPGQIDSALDHLSKADVLIGHNICFYDIPVLFKLKQFQFKGSIIDTLLCTRVIWPKEKLYDLDCEQYPQVPVHLRGTAGLKAWGYRLSDHKINFKDFKEYSQEMLEYCIQDVKTTTTLFRYIQNQTVSPACLRLEHDFASAIEKQIRTGFPFDTDAALDLVDVLETRKEELERSLKETFPPVEHETWFVPKVNNKARGYEKGVPFKKIRVEEFNPGSRDQIVSRLKDKYNWQPDNCTEKGNPILNDDVLEKLPYPEAKPLAEYMLVSKRLGQIKDGKNAWLKLVTSDDHIHGDMVTNGCITGRCSHRNPNMGQVPAVYSPYGKDCRHLFHAPDGYLLVGIDAKALELRCLAGYLAHWDNGEYASLVTDETIDIHIYNQERFGVETRDISKRLLYGVIYGAGNLKAGTIIDPNEKDETVLRQLGANAINSFMSGVPALKKLKHELQTTLSSRGYLIGLDGRPLFCRSDFKALNVLLQSAGAILMKQVVINIHNNMKQAGLVYGVDWQQHAMIHDEVQLSCLPEHLDLVMQQATEAFPAAGRFFGFLCEIEGDVKHGKHWDDTH